MPIDFREPHNALAFRMISEQRGNTDEVPFHSQVPSSEHIFRYIHSQMADQNINTVILCSEVFSNFSAISPTLIQRLRDEFDNCSVRIMCSLRRIDEYLISWQGQRLKFGEKPEPLREESGINSYLPSVHFDFQLLLQSWIDCFKGADLVIRNYADVRTAGGSELDFINFCGVKFPKNLSKFTMSNPGLPRALYEIFRLANINLSADSAINFQLKINHLVSGGFLKLPQNVELLGQRNRHSLIEHFSPIHEFIGECAGQKPFFPDLEDALLCQGMDELEATKRVHHQLLAQENKLKLSLEQSAFLRDIAL